MRSIFKSRRGRERGSGLKTWQHLTSCDEVDALIGASKESPFVFFIFKHSPRCSISSVVKHRLEKDERLRSYPHFYFLDLIAHRDVSNCIEEKFGVRHESLQLIAGQNGRVLKHGSHGMILPDDYTPLLNEK